MLTCMHLGLLVLSPNFTVADRATIRVSLIDVDCFRHCVMCYTTCGSVVSQN